MLTYCLTKIKNIERDRYEIPAQELTRLKRGKRPSEILRAGMGSEREINRLFGALLIAAGLDARVALLSGRDERLFFRPELLNPFFFNRSAIAVGIDGEWRFFDLSEPYLQPGALSWPEEGVAAMIPDPERTTFSITPMTGPLDNVATRSADFRLLDDGTLEGAVRAVYEGHLSVEQKEIYGGGAPERRAELLREKLEEEIGEAEFSDISIQNATDPTKSLGYTYRVRIPRHATRTRKRLFLQPSYFHRNSVPMFSASKRTHDIYLHYPWSEKEAVVIELPEGFRLENPESPVSYVMPAVGGYDANVWMLDPRKLAYRRDFKFGENSSIIVPASEYEHLKLIFDGIHEQDQHTLALQRSPSATVQ